MGREGQTVPEMTSEIINMISERYIELYEQVAGESFVKADQDELLKRVEKNVLEYLQTKVS